MGPRSNENCRVKVPRFTPRPDPGLPRQELELTPDLVASPPMGLIKMHSNRVQENISFKKKKGSRKRVLDCSRTVPGSFLGTCPK